MHVSGILKKAVQLWPNKEAIVCGELRFTYKEFKDRVNRLSCILSGSGLSPGSRIAILHENCHVFLESYFAVADADLVLVPINSGLSAKELRFILNDSGARILIANMGLMKKVRLAILDASDQIELDTILWTNFDVSECQSINNIKNLNYEKEMAQIENYDLIRSEFNSKLAQIYYTSGTTGKPKGVMLTHDNVVTHAIGTIAELQLTESDVWAHIAPLYHLADAWATFAITMVGGKHVLVENFKPSLVLKTIRDEGMTISNLIPTMLNILVNEPNILKKDFPKIRCILSGGAPIAPELVRKIIEVFKCEYIQTYGMTETSPYLTMSILKDHLKELPEDEKFRYVSRTGRAFITIELKLVDESGHDVRPNDKDVGEIWVKGPTITPGYWNDTEETETAFCDGWLKTGDLAVIDSEGYVNIVDRKKDMILTGGENVYSTEVEHVLYEHPGILEATVVGIPDDKWGEAVNAVVVLKEGIDVNEAEVIEFCKVRLTHYKVPKSVDFVSYLPKTGSGKINKKVIRDKYWVGYKKRVH
jgi:acyl-CoA synthetase (AMP-forming)/AMP-acid ligase II